MKVSVRNHKRIIDLYLNENFGIEELAIMYTTSKGEIERILERWEEL